MIFYSSFVLIQKNHPNQCPCTVKNVNEIREAAEKIFKIKPMIIDLKNYKDAQESPCAFGTFCIVYNGEVIAEHPISNTRFTNIMNNLIIFNI